MTLSRPYRPIHSHPRHLPICALIRTAMAAVVAVSFAINPALKMAATSRAYLERSGAKETVGVMITDLRFQFNHLGWVSGDGGNSKVKVYEDSINKPQPLDVMSPTGVQKERMAEVDMYVFSSAGSVLKKPRPHKPPESSDCGPLLLEAYKMRSGVFHGMESCFPTTDPLSQDFRPEWYNFLCDAAIKFNQLGFDQSSPSRGLTQMPNGVPSGHHISKVVPKAGISSNVGEPPRRCIVLDIEGTTTPISFVTDVLFPYARDNVGKHLELTFDTEETQDDIKLLRTQVQEDLENGVAGAVPIPSDGSKEEVIAALVANVEAMIKVDRKITSLKQLQGHIWRTGFRGKEIETVVYDDVPDALEKWNALGLKVYIYSSGSRLAQRLLFGNTNYGDLRKYLCGFFDTTVGNKKETKSYVEIAESLGVDDPSEILFVTDVYPEATAAEAAGLNVIISIRPGNGPLPEKHGFRTVKSFSEI